MSNDQRTDNNGWKLRGRVRADRRSGGLFEWRQRAREQTEVVPCRGWLWQSKSDLPIITRDRERGMVGEESGQGTASGVVLCCGAGGERERAHAQYGGVAAAAPLELDKLRIPSRHGTMAAVCGFVVTLHRQTNGCRSRAAVGSTSSAAAGYWLLRVCSRNSWLGLFRLHLRFRYFL